VSTHRTSLRFWERCRPGGGLGFKLQLVPKGISRRELQLNTPAGRQRSQATDRRSREMAEGRVDARPEAEVIGDIRASPMRVIRQHLYANFIGPFHFYFQVGFALLGGEAV